LFTLLPLLDWSRDSADDCNHSADFSAEQCKTTLPSDASIFVDTSTPKKGVKAQKHPRSSKLDLLDTYRRLYYFHQSVRILQKSSDSFDYPERPIWTAVTIMRISVTHSKRSRVSDATLLHLSIQSLHRNHNQQEPQSTGTTINRHPQTHIKVSTPTGRFIRKDAPTDSL